MQSFHPSTIYEHTVFMRKVYAWMSLGLAFSGVTAFVVGTNPSFYTPIIENEALFKGLIIFDFLLVLFLVFLIKQIPAILAELTYLFYCFMTGLTLSVIFLVFTYNSIQLIFFITAGMFAAMSVYGYYTKTDLTGIGQVLVMGLFGIVIAGVANLWMQNSILDFWLSVIGVFVFTGLTAYDTQKIRNHNILGNDGTPEDRKEVVMGALTLYLDFMNLFLDLLRLFGKRK